MLPPVESQLSSESAEMVGASDIGLENPREAAHLGRARKIGRVNVKE